MSPGTCSAAGSASVNIITAHHLSRCVEHVVVLPGYFIAHLACSSAAVDTSCWASVESNVSFDIQDHHSLCLSHTSQEMCIDFSLPVLVWNVFFGAILKPVLALHSKMNVTLMLEMRSIPALSESRLKSKVDIDVTSHIYRHEWLEKIQPVWEHWCCFFFFLKKQLYCVMKGFASKTTVRVCNKDYRKVDERGVSNSKYIS